MDWLKLESKVEPRSLVWDGDELVDWVGGGARYHLDGSATRSRVNYAYDFDAATALPNSEWAINGGVLEREWPEIQSGSETSSIRGYSPKPLPPLALDPNHCRFAVANGTTIHVVRIAVHA